MFTEPLYPPETFTQCNYFLDKCLLDIQGHDFLLFRHHPSNLHSQYKENFLQVHEQSSIHEKNNKHAMKEFFQAYEDLKGSDQKGYKV